MTWRSSRPVPNKLRPFFHDLCQGLFKVDWALSVPCWGHIWERGPPSWMGGDHMTIVYVPWFKCPLKDLWGIQVHAKQSCVAPCYQRNPRQETILRSSGPYWTLKTHVGFFNGPLTGSCEAFSFVHMTLSKYGSSSSLGACSRYPTHLVHAIIRTI